MHERTGRGRGRRRETRRRKGNKARRRVKSRGAENIGEGGRGGEERKEEGE